MTSTQYSEGPRGARSRHCSLCTVSCSGVDVCASHMKGIMNQNLHTGIQKSITSEPMPQSVIYTRGLDSTPETSIKLNIHTSHSSQTSGLGSPALVPQSPVLSCRTLLPAEAMAAFLLMKGNSTPHFSTLLRWTADHRSTGVGNCIQPLCLVIIGELHFFFRPQPYDHIVSPNKGWHQGDKP